MATNKEPLPVADQNGTKKAQTNSGEQNENPTVQTPTDQTSSSKRKPDESHAKDYLRVSKENLYMIIALWMEDFVNEAPERNYRKVGAVLVLPNDVVCAADCSRDGVHAVARLLMKHYDKAKGSKMFMSRKPCSLCAKLLVQSKVERVLFLPFEPEYYRSPEASSKDETPERIKESNKTQMKQVDNLFTASPIAQTIFVLHVEESVLERAKKKTPTDEEQNVEKEKRRLIDQKYRAFRKGSKWMTSIKEEIPWPAFDSKMELQFQEYFEQVMEWIPRVLVVPQSDNPRGLNFDFELCGTIKPPSGGVFNPVNDETAEQAKHLIEIARFLATRTDDPKTGVGAVIVSREMQILALGWNGFPLKAQYGEFGRGSKDDDSEDKKYPYVIHAEQNALLMRNEKNIKGAILFVTRSPCNECTPLIAMQGIETVVVDEDVLSRDTAQEKGLSYKKFPNMVKEGKFICYQTKEKPVDAKDLPASNQTIRELKDFKEPCEQIIP